MKKDVVLVATACFHPSPSERENSSERCPTGTMTLLDGSKQVTNTHAMKRAVKHLCMIRGKVAAKYLSIEPTRPNHHPTVMQLRDYKMTGTAVKECHDIFKDKLKVALRVHHEANPNRKKPFDLRGACRPIEKRIPPARCQHPSETSND